MHHGGNGWVDLPYFYGYDQRITEINLEKMERPVILATYLDSGHLNISIIIQIKT